MKNFAERKAALETLGWKYTVEKEYRGEAPREKHSLEIFKEVRLPLTPEDWCVLCMREGDEYVAELTPWKPRRGGEYIGGCCGNMSAVQDQLNAWFRDGGWVKVHDLVELGEAMRDHGDEDFSEQPPETVAEGVKAFVFMRDHPDPTRCFSAWGKIGLLYQLVKDHYVPEAKLRGQYVDDLEQSFMLVSRMSWTFGMGNFFTRGNATSNTTNNAQKLMRLFRFVPALQQIYERIQEIAPEPVEGWAVVDQEHNGDVAENGYGLCVYATKPEAERIIKLFQEAEAQYEEKLSPSTQEARFKARAVRISIDKGLEFLEPGTAPRPKIKKNRKPHWVTEETDNVSDLFEQYTKSRYNLTKEHDSSAYLEARMAWSEAAEYFGQNEE